jgi:hypothetical protein
MLQWRGVWLKPQEILPSAVPCRRQEETIAASNPTRSRFVIREDRDFRERIIRDLLAGQNIVVGSSRIGNKEAFVTKASTKFSYPAKESLSCYHIAGMESNADGHAFKSELCFAKHFSMSSFSYSVTNVVFVSTQKQMLWIAAPPIVALVAYAQSSFDKSMAQFPNNSVNTLCAGSKRNPYHSITAQISGSIPIPAPA